MNIGEIALGLSINQQSFNNQIKSISRGADTAVKNAFSGMGRKIGSLLGAFAIGAFAKDCLELGSNLSEVQNVVDVTFGSMSKQINQWSKDAMVNFGLSETVAKQYTGTIGAMSKAFGFAGQDMVKMSTEVAGLTADVASFYNLSTDEAFTKMKSIFTGETEALKDLGVVMTQTALDQYALNEGFGKTTAQMTEQEKVMLRYQFVMSKLSSAQGDFMRTSDGWANQIRVLKLRFDALKASIGQGLINVLTPVVKAINLLLSKLQVVAQGFADFTELLTGKKQSFAPSSTNVIDNASDSISNMGNNASDTASKVADVGNATTETAKKIERSLAGFDKITKLSAPSTDSGSSSGGSGVISDGGLGSITSSGSGLMGAMAGETETATNKMSAAFDKLKKALSPTIDAFKRLKSEGLSELKDFTWTALRDFYDKFLVPLGQWTLGTGLPDFLDTTNDLLKDIDWDKLNKSLGDYWDELEPFSENVGEGLLWFYDNVFRPLATTAVNDAVVNFIDMLSASLKVLNAVADKFKDSKNDDNIIGFLVKMEKVSIGNVGEWFKEIAEALNDLAEFIENPSLGKLGDLLLSIREAFNESPLSPQNSPIMILLETITGFDLGKWYNKNIKPWLSADKWEVSIGNVGEWFKEISEAINALFDFIENPSLGTYKDVILGIYEAFAESPLSFQNSPIMTLIEMITGFDLGDWYNENIKPWLSADKWKVEVIEIKAKVATKWADIKGKWNTLTNNFKAKTVNFSAKVSTTAATIKSKWNTLSNNFKAKAVNFSAKVSTAATTIKNGWNNLSNNFKAKTVDFKVKLSTAVGSIKNFINDVIKAINKHVIAKLDFSIKAPSWLGGAKFQWKAPRIPEIKKLAQGGYVKANTPQLAIIGDNTKYGEIVAPEDKMLSMALTAAKMAAGGSDKLLQEIIWILKEIEKKEINLDGKSISKTVIKEINNRRRASGVIELI